MGMWTLDSRDIQKGEIISDELERERIRAKRLARKAEYEKISNDLRKIKTQMTKDGDLILFIPSASRVRIKREYAIAFAKWILAEVKTRGKKTKSKVGK